MGVMCNKVAVGMRHAQVQKQCHHPEVLRQRCHTIQTVLSSVFPGSLSEKWREATDLIHRLTNLEPPKPSRI